MKPRLKGNLAMGAAKTFSGLNENALRYLLPQWMSAYTGVVLRLGFGAILFWIVGWICKFRVHKNATSPPAAAASGQSAASPQATATSASATAKERTILFLIGAVLMLGYMIFLLLGLTYTTPISSSMFISTEPVWVFLLCVIFFGERVTPMKVVGIALGLGGALLCIFTQKQSDVASNPMLGDIYCALSAIVYSIYLVVLHHSLSHIDTYTVTKWTFLGGAASSAIMVIFTGWDAPVLAQGLFSTPMLVLLFVLIFPTALGYFLTYIGLQNLKATVVALYGYVILIVATVVSYILGQDRFDWLQIIAMLLIVASVYFVEVAERK